MKGGIEEKEQDARIAYADIIDLPRWQSPSRTRMSLYDRSAQFSSYKALSGYEDMIGEEARVTDEELELSEYSLGKINRKLNLISDASDEGQHPTLTFTVFVPDEKKSGGKYIQITDAVKKIDAAERKVVLMSRTGKSGLNRTIPFESIAAIRGDLVDPLDEALE